MQQLPQQLPGYFTVWETISGVQFPMLLWDLGVFASVGCPWAAMGSLWGAHGRPWGPCGVHVGGHGSLRGAHGRPWGACGAHIGGHVSLWGAHGRQWGPCGVHMGAHGVPVGAHMGAHGIPVGCTWAPIMNIITSPPHLHPKTCFNVCFTTEAQTKLGLKTL